MGGKDRGVLGVEHGEVVQHGLNSLVRAVFAD
jgi:hypothetical protein